MTTAPIQPNRSPTGHDGGADPEGEALVDALAHSAFVVMGALTRIGAEHELSLTQLRVLGILRDRTPRMAELADYLEVFMTAAGLELAERVHTEVRRALDPATGRLDATERQALTRLLERMLGSAPA